MRIDEPTAATYRLTSYLGTASLAKLALIGAILLGLAAGFAYVAGWLSPRRLTPAAMIDGFEQVNGVQAGFRRNHAKGVCFSGYFDGNGQAAALSKAAVFNEVRTPVTGRFALAGGKPFMLDNPSAVRSMALRFDLANGQEWRTGMNAIPVFVVNTAQGFYEQVLASQPDPATGKPDATKQSEFLAHHPEAARAIAAIKATPFATGFANSTFNSLDAFRLVNARAESVAVRWAMVPTEPYVAESAGLAGTADKNYLFDELIARVRSAPLTWHLIITVAQAGDATNDATVAWPENRRRVDAGTLTVERIAAEAADTCRDINFDPLVLPVGIGASDDPLLSARSAAYSQSFRRRAGEPKTPSAVLTAAPAGGGAP